MAVEIKDINKIQPKEKPFMVSVKGESDLCLEIFPSGRKTWKFRRMENGKQIKITLGNYDDVEMTIQEVRNRAGEIRTKLYRGEPIKKEVKEPEMKFKELAERFVESKTNSNLTAEYLKTIHIRLNKYLLPAVGKLELSQITGENVVNLYEQISKEPNSMGGNKTDTASRVKHLLGQIMRYGKSINKTQNDPTVGIRFSKPNRHNHFAYAKGKMAIQKLINAIYYYQFPVLRGLLLFNLLTFVRPNEARGAMWEEIEELNGNQIWRIPPGKMKGRREHLVPLSDQSLIVLKEMEIHRRDEYIFPSGRLHRTISNTAALQVLRSRGYPQGTMTVHGFRHTASTRLNEEGFNRDVIEAQLAHIDETTRGVYNAAEWLPERIDLMRWWGDYLWSLIIPS